MLRMRTLKPQRDTIDKKVGLKYIPKSIDKRNCKTINNHVNINKHFCKETTILYNRIIKLEYFELFVLDSQTNIHYELLDCQDTVL